MADDPFQEDELPRDALDAERPELPEPDLLPPDTEAPELPEPDVVPPDIQLEQIESPQQTLPEPDLTTPLPGQENAPFQVDQPAEQAGSQGGDGMQELVAIGERLVEPVEEINDKMDDLLEKLDSVGTYGQ